VLGRFVAVDGFTHKVAFPGFETRSGESFGLTATFHVVTKADSPGQPVGNITRLAVEGGRVVRFDEVAQGVRLVRDSS
jgi:hypothetical protein